MPIIFNQAVRAQGCCDAKRYVSVRPHSCRHVFPSGLGVSPQAALAWTEKLSVDSRHVGPVHVCYTTPPLQV